MARVPQEASSPPAAFVDIPWPYRLGTRIFLSTILVAVAVLAALAITDAKMSQQIEEQAIRSNALLAETIQATTRSAMLLGIPSHAYRSMDGVGRIPGVLRMRVLDKDGRIVISSKTDEIGTVFPKSAPLCQKCHASAQPVSRVADNVRGRVEVVEGERAITTLSPIYSERSCTTASCHGHPPGRSVLGLLEIAISLTSVDRYVDAFRYRTLLIAAATVMILAWFFWQVARAELVEPVAALVEGTHRVSRNELDVEIRVASRGEMGFLASSFNDMTRSLRRLQADLDGLMSNLERQVEDRTADLKAAQEQLLRTEKLSSLGKLSASIAHEINNPLAGILTFAKLVSRKLGDGELVPEEREKVLKHLALVEREAYRCSVIVKNLLDFARERPMLVKPADVNQAVDEILTLLDNQAHIQGHLPRRSYIDGMLRRPPTIDESRCAGCG